jgi:hypothetical protein
VVIPSSRALGADTSRFFSDMVVLVGGVLARQPRGCHCSSTDPGSSDAALY